MGNEASGSEPNGAEFIRPYAVQLRMLQDYALLFLNFHLLPACHNAVQAVSYCIRVYIAELCTLALMDQSREERERECRAREAPEQREARL